MLCSVRTTKAAPSWLDRLRSSKGFPVQNGLALDHFLANPNPNSPPRSQQTVSFVSSEESSEEKPTSSETCRSTRAERMPTSTGHLFDLMSSVLSELFNMGDQSNHPNPVNSRPLEERRRAFRKQSNPKICAFSVSGSIDDSSFAPAHPPDRVPSMSPSSADNSVAEGVIKNPRKHGVVEEEISQATAVEADLDLSTFLRAEVTIIDTSASSWKSEKLIFRKGNVWKIRDKKLHLGSMSRKKRKGDQFDESVAREEKQQKPFSSSSKVSKEATFDHHVISSNGGSTRNSKQDPNHILERRPQFSRMPRKPATKDSSVFLIQCIPTSGKSDVSISKSRLKDKL